MKNYKSLIVKSITALLVLISLNTTVIAADENDANSADLGVSMPTYEPTENLNPGDEIDVTFTVTNVGTSVSQGFAYTIYIDNEEQFQGEYDHNIAPEEIKEITAKPVELIDDETVTLKIWIQPYNNDENGSNNQVSINIDLYDDFGEGDLSDCMIVGYGTYYGADYNKELQVGVLNKEKNIPCYDDAALEDFTWTSTEPTIAEIIGDGLIETKDIEGIALIQAIHKGSGEYETFILNVGNIFDDRNDFVDVLSDRESKYGSDITDLLDFVSNISSDLKAVKILKAKADVLEAVEALYIKLAEIDAVNKIDESTWSKIEGVTDYITSANFYKLSAQEMIDDIQRYTATISSSLHVLTEETNALKAEYDTNYDDASEEKYEEEIIPFIDTVELLWYTPFVTYVKENEIVSGYKTENGELTGLYGPSDNITGAELLKMAFETSYFNYPSSYACTTSDGNICTEMESHWAWEYFQKAKFQEFSIVDNSENFSPNIPALRGEVVRTFLEAFGYDLGNSCDSSFDDVDSDNRFSCYVEKAKELGIVSGDDNTNNFRPYAEINRAEVAKIAQNCSELLVATE